MIDIPKKYGQLMIKEHPELISRTSHKRHYYMVDSPKAWNILKEIKKEAGKDC